MDGKYYIKIFSPREGDRYGNFFVYIPAGEGAYAQYRFVYMNNPPKDGLGFSEGPNDPANCEFYRVREAYIGRLSGETFTPSFRALQGGEIGFAFCEKGAGDFCGGFHGDEVMTSVGLKLDGKEVDLGEQSFRSFDTFEFGEESYIYRCNTPDLRLALHRQKYTVERGALMLSQYIEWVNDALPLVAAYSPMLTVQRLDPADTSRVITDRVEFFDREGGLLLKTFDTSEYGEILENEFSKSVCRDTPATAVRVFGEKSGFCAECGYSVADGSIPKEQIDTHLCIRFAKCLDNKIYFNIGKNTVPKAGTVWKSDIFYRLKYDLK